MSGKQDDDRTNGALDDAKARAGAGWRRFAGWAGPASKKAAGATGRSLGSATADFGRGLWWTTKATGRGVGYAGGSILRHPVRTALVLLLGLVGGLAVAAALFIGSIWWNLPDEDQVLANAEQVLILQDHSGAPLLTRNAVPSAYLRYDEIPDAVIGAVVAIEDRRFFEHDGVDLRAIARAAVQNVTAGGIAQGGSTLTQQLAKVMYLTPERTLSRKLQEALLARRLEREFGKEGVLERYLNVIYLGSGARGMSAAAQVYFSRDLDELTLAQIAMLAASIQTPSAVNPISDLEATKARARIVLDNMVELGMIDAATREAARTEMVTIRPEPAQGAYGSWFADWVLPRAETIADEFDGIVTLRTTLDPGLQALAEEVVARNLQGTDLEVALVALRGDGSVAAMVGGRDYGASQFNRATGAERSPGSTFKTFVVLAALAEGTRPDSIVSDRPIDLDGYAPENFDGEYLGEITLREAYVRSRNVPMVALGQKLGPERIVEAARALGITADLSPTAALPLGADGVPLIDMVEAYAAIAANRAPITAHGVEGFFSNESGEYHRFRWPLPQAEGLAAELLAHRPEMLDMMQDVITDGTGRNAQLGRPAAGKTGTGQDFRDALFIGFDQYFVVGVWVGNDDNSPMDEVGGGSLPAQIWHDFLIEAPNVAQPSATPAAPAEVPEPEPEPVETAATDTPARENVEPNENGVVENALPQVEDDGSGGESDGPRIVAVEPSDGATVPVIEASEVTASSGGVDLAEESVTRTLQAVDPDGDGRLDPDAVELLLREMLGEGGDGPLCNVRACERAYRSFRESDCTYQPYSGPRKLCTR